MIWTEKGKFIVLIDRPLVKWLSAYHFARLLFVSNFNFIPPVFLSAFASLRLNVMGFKVKDVQQICWRNKIPSTTNFSTHTHTHVKRMAWNNIWNNVCVFEQNHDIVYLHLSIIEILSSNQLLFDISAKFLLIGQKVKNSFFYYSSSHIECNLQLDLVYN